MNIGVVLLFIIGVLLYVLGYSVWMLKKGVHSMRLILFGFAMACALLSYTYWCIFDLMYADEEKALPFAANELGEWALFLLLGATLTFGLAKKRVSLFLEMEIMLFFVAVNVTLWIHWNGEWMQDIVTGLVMAYLLSAIIRRMKYSGKFTRKQWILLALGGYLAVAFQIVAVWTEPYIQGCFIIEPPLHDWAEKIGYVYLLVVSLVLLGVSLAELLKKGSAERSICLSFMSIAFCTFSMYMSDGIWYILEMFGSTLAFLLMFFSLRKEVVAS